MSKGLEALKRSFDNWNYLKDYETIEKELKALEIIKEKLSPLARYTFLPMTQEEFNLVKEILSNDN